MPDDDTRTRRDDTARGSLSACCIALIVGGNNANRLAVGCSSARPEVADRQFHARSDGSGGIAWGIRRADGSNDEIRAADARAAKRKPKDDYANASDQDRRSAYVNAKRQPCGLPPVSGSRGH